MREWNVGSGVGVSWHAMPRLVTPSSAFDTEVPPQVYPHNVTQWIWSKQWSLNNTKNSWALYQRAVVTLLLSGLFLPAVMGSPEWFELLRKSFCVQPFVVDASQSLKPKSNPRRWWTCKQRGAKVLENCKIALSLPFTIQVPVLHHGISSQRKKLSLISNSTQNRVQIKEPESRGGSQYVIKFTWLCWWFWLARFSQDGRRYIWRGGNFIAVIIIKKSPRPWTIKDFHSAHPTG